MQIFEPTTTSADAVAACVLLHIVGIHRGGMLSLPERPGVVAEVGEPSSRFRTDARPSSSNAPHILGNAICCEEFGHELQPKSPSAKLGKLSSFGFLASYVGIAPSRGM